MIDASVMLKLLLPEEGSEVVHGLSGEWIEGDAEITARFLLAYEVVSVRTADRGLAASLRRKAARIRLV